MEEKIVTSNVLSVLSPNKRARGFKYVLYVCGAILAILAMIMWMGGDNPFPSIGGTILCIVIGIRNAGSTMIDIRVALEIMAVDGRVTLVYPQIDKNDGKGVRRETYVYLAQDLGIMQYNASENAMRIEGMAVLTTEYRTGGVEVIDGRQFRKAYNFVIYFEDDSVRQKLLTVISDSMGRCIQEI